jgi:hypothetical protein
MCEHGETAEIITLDGKSISVDKCMQERVQRLNDKGTKTRGCCCGHGKYYPTIILSSNSPEAVIELYSGIIIWRTKRFYKKDANGYYYIPEVEREAPE